MAHRIAEPVARFRAAEPGCLGAGTGLPGFACGKTGLRRVGGGPTRPVEIPTSTEVAKHGHEFNARNPAEPLHRRQWRADAGGTAAAVADPRHDGRAAGIPSARPDVHAEHRDLAGGAAGGDLRDAADGLQRVSDRAAVRDPAAPVAECRQYPRRPAARPRRPTCGRAGDPCLWRLRHRRQLRGRHHRVRHPDPDQLHGRDQGCRARLRSLRAFHS